VRDSEARGELCEGGFLTVWGLGLSLALRQEPRMQEQTNQHGQKTTSKILEIKRMDLRWIEDIEKKGGWSRGGGGRKHCANPPERGSKRAETSASSIKGSA